MQPTYLYVHECVTSDRFVEFQTYFNLRQVSQGGILVQTVPFFYLVAKIACLCVYMVRYLPPQEILGLPLYMRFSFLCKSSCLHLTCVYSKLLWTTTAEKPVQCQVLYIALCLCDGKVPLICVSVSLRRHYTLLVKC